MHKPAEGDVEDEVGDETRDGVVDVEALVKLPINPSPVLFRLFLFSTLTARVNGWRKRRTTIVFDSNMIAQVFVCSLSFVFAKNLVLCFSMLAH